MGILDKGNDRLLKSQVYFEVHQGRNHPLKTPKSYHIIQKAEKQLLYERVRNINNTIYVYEIKRSECYIKLKNLIWDRDISHCMLLINKIKDTYITKPDQGKRINLTD